jgi:hypothetical protein
MKVASGFGDIKVLKQKRSVLDPELESYTECRSVRRS